MKERKRRFVRMLAMLLVLPACALAGDAKNAAKGNLQTYDAEPVMEPNRYETLEYVTAQADDAFLRMGVVKTAERDGAATLYAAPDEGSDVLMTYYSGAPLEIIRQSGAFCRVQVGVPGASVTGYMRAQDVAAGDMAERTVGPAYMELQFNQEAPVYAYCDESAPVIGRCFVGSAYYAMGKNDDKWVQLYLPPVNHVWEEEGRITKGFVKLDTGLARGYWHAPAQWTIEPGVGEITREQAIRLAVDHLTGTGNASLPEIYTQRDALENMHCRAQYMQTQESLVNDWWVYFWENAGSDVVRVYVYGGGDGSVSMHHDYIAAGETGYGIQMTL